MNFNENLYIELKRFLLKRNFFVVDKMNFNVPYNHDIILFRYMDSKTNLDGNYRISITLKRKKILFFNFHYMIINNIQYTDYINTKNKKIKKIKTYNWEDINYKYRVKKIFSNSSFYRKLNKTVVKLMKKVRLNEVDCG